ncbi:MAG: glycoside hydrolase family 55 protein [Thermoanaerobaculia bacterium]|nr:glycoside hydrolase family 55 protein [Thermoanaerobaculia bacterium]
MGHPVDGTIRARIRWRCACALLVAFALGCSSEPPELAAGHSRLWGERGERFDPAGPITDFSFAGYRFGEAPLPDVPRVADVRGFGAVGDGVADDTAAFRAALAASGPGAIEIPPGRYRLTDVLHLATSGQVLRGAGSGATVLAFDRHLGEVLPKGPFGGPRGYAWGGGFLWAAGGFGAGEELATVAAPARRGAYELRVSEPGRFAPGQLVRLLQFDDAAGTLVDALHGGIDLGGRCQVGGEGSRLEDRLLRVVAVDGARVRFDRPLRLDVRPEWKPELRTFEPQLEEIGIERLTIEFPLVDYPGHHKEPGYNAIFLFKTWNSWVRDVELVNFDNGIHFHFSRNATGKGLVVRGRGGHYSLSVRGSHDTLVTDFRLETTSQHDLSNALLGNGNVYSRGSGVDLNFDHHRYAPFDNLYTAIDVGASWRTRRIWKCSATKSGHLTAARETFWGVGPRILAAKLPRWPAMTIVGPLDAVPGPEHDLGGWFEPIAELAPADLHAAQLERRLGRLP